MPLPPARAASPSPASHRPTSRRLLLTALGASLLAVPALAYRAADAATAAGTATDTAAETAADTGLDDPAKKDIAMRLVSSAENSSLEWEEQYDYVEDIGDGRGYTGGIIGFCSGTSDMLALVELYTERVADNPLADYAPALRAVNGTDSHEGLDPGFPDAWREAAATAAFRTAQRDERDRVYFDPAVARAKEDGLGALGQFVYYDAMVMHGPGTDTLSFGGIRGRALLQAASPTEGGDETGFLHAFLDARGWAMEQEEAHSDVSRVETAQRVFLAAGNLALDPPLNWRVYGDSYTLS
ncbi:chitosanase [Streptomyces europaeiscabiei]|uniref:chitosanase n=1 Tax=Streptomyces europaeiscabiei TaxID=146819 RepID=UPI0029A737A8|nr:chitosanase [Streptomyces europaeiscabiei]MDX3707686.1 chitosanase [Streptomyces europaeiscabiei]MDX3859940.1 chitosanase [Streptomyces europaeiscabiei]MDX3869910.1 chitosanase [Streptomyces europaeiscabiei]